MNYNIKCLAVGRTRKNELEFGEFYHLATALILRPESKYVLFGEIPKGIITFLDLFGETPKPLDVKKYNKFNYHSIGYTADIFKMFIGKHDELSKVKTKFISLIDDNLSNDHKEQIKKKVKKLNLNTKTKKCFVWIRKGKYKPNRNISSIGLIQLKNILNDFNIEPLFVGATIGDFKKENNNNLIEFYNDEPFNNCNILEQLYLFRILIEEYNFLFSVGMKSGSMDGLAFAFNFRTFYFATNDSNKRMNKVSQVFSQLIHIKINGTKYDEFISFHDDDIRRFNGYIKALYIKP